MYRIAKDVVARRRSRPKSINYMEIGDDDDNGAEDSQPVTHLPTSKHTKNSNNPTFVIHIRKPFL